MCPMISVPTCRLTAPHYLKPIGSLTARHPKAPRVAHAVQNIQGNLPFQLIAQQEWWTASVISLPDHSSWRASVNAVYASADSL
jgi:hypothetical protein